MLKLAATELYPWRAPSSRLAGQLGPTRACICAPFDLGAQLGPHPGAQLGPRQRAPRLDAHLAPPKAVRMGDMQRHLAVRLGPEKSCLGRAIFPPPSRAPRGACKSEPSAS